MEGTRDKSGGGETGWNKEEVLIQMCQYGAEMKKLESQNQKAEDIKKTKTRKKPMEGVDSGAGVMVKV